MRHPPDLVARVKAAAPFFKLNALSKMTGVHVNTICAWRKRGCRREVPCDPNVMLEIEKLLRG